MDKCDENFLETSADGGVFVPLHKNDVVFAGEREQLFENRIVQPFLKDSSKYNSIVAYQNTGYHIVSYGDAKIIKKNGDRITAWFHDYNSSLKLELTPPLRI